MTTESLTMPNPVATVERMENNRLKPSTGFSRSQLTVQRLGGGAKTGLDAARQQAASHRRRQHRPDTMSQQPTRRVMA